MNHKYLSFVFSCFILFTTVFLPLNSYGQNPPDSIAVHIQTLDKLVNIEPQWTLNTGNESPRIIKKNESFPYPEFSLDTIIKGQSFSCGNSVLDTPMVLEINCASRGLSRIEVVVNGNTVDTFELDGSSGTTAEAIKKIQLTPTVKTEDYTVKLKVKNLGFKPVRTGNWPPRKKDVEEEGIYFSVAQTAITYPIAENSYTLMKDWLLSMRIGYALLYPDFKRYTFIGAPVEIADKRKTPKKRLDSLKKALEASVLSIKPEMLENGKPATLLKAIDLSYQVAKPLKEFAKEFKIYLIGNAHIDIAWLWRMRETVMVARNTFDTLIKNMKEYPELRYAQSQAIIYYWMEKKYPEIFEQIKQKIKDGQWEIVGGMWVEPDCNLIAGESWVRQIMFGKRYFKSRFGIDVDTGWNPDSFGYNWNMPQFYTKSGIKRFITQKIRWNDTTVFPHFIFWWQGVDGTKLMTYFPPASYTSMVRFPEDTPEITRYEATTGYKKTLILYGLGDHGGGPNREILDRVRSYKKLQIAPDFIHAKSIEFLKNLETDLKNEIPVWNDELYLEYHRGTYTTQGLTKKNNRRSESMLSAAEKFASIAFMMDSPYPVEPLEEAWKTTLTNQFHDILPGSSINPVYKDAADDYKVAQEKIRGVQENATLGIAGKIDTTTAKGTPLIIFNPLSWLRTDAVSVSVPLSQKESVEILDEEGKPVPFEMKPLSFNQKEAVVNFIAKNIPPVGYSVYSLVKKETPVSAENTKITEGVTDDFIQMENKFFTLKINKKTGNIASLFDKRMNKEFIEQGKEGNVLQIHEDRPERWDAWDIGYTGRMWEINKAESVEWVENSDLRKVVKIEKTFLGFTKDREAPTETFPSSFFTQYVIMYNDIDRIDIKTDADWWEDHMLLKAAFPVTIKNDMATYEIPFASIQRTTKYETLWEKARYEVSALRWADLSDNTGGISILNDCKYGYDIHGNIMRISLLRSPTWPDPMADRGKHTFTYSIYTHPGTVTEGSTIRRAQELNIPLTACLSDSHNGTLPAKYSFFDVNTPGVILETVKKAEDDNSIIIRCYEAFGKDSDAMLSFFKEPKSIVETDLLENKTLDHKVTGKSLALKFKKFEIKTLKINF